MQYVYFDDEAREYVITNPRTPVKWINYVGTLALGGFVDHTGGALICKGDPALNRITRYLAWLPASALQGTILYLRLAQELGFADWNDTVNLAAGAESPFIAAIEYRMPNTQPGGHHALWLFRRHKP